MHLFLFIFGLFVFQIYATSNFNPDYPHIKYCVIPNDHPSTEEPYKYLKRQLALDLGCTHIRGSLFIEDIHPYPNGTDPDLSFLENIVEISGKLRIKMNSVRKIPLGNLKIIRGKTSLDDPYALEISHNGMNMTHFVEEIDLHSLRVIMEKNVRINLNPGLEYLVYKVDWHQILVNTTSQILNIQPTKDDNQNTTYKCDPSCKSWPTNTTNSGPFCFGPRKQDCQQRVKCASTKSYTWCRFTNDNEMACDRQCIGGCTGDSPQDCSACRGLIKKDQCVGTCEAQGDSLFGSKHYSGTSDKFIYKTGALCTSQCPESLLDQDKNCIYECDFTKYYKSGKRCIECPNQLCYKQIGDQLMCDLKSLADPSLNKLKRQVMTKTTLKKLTNCTIIIGDFFVNDLSFRKHGVTTEMLYDNLKKVQEIIGDLTIHLNFTFMTNLTFLSNLREVRGVENALKSGLKVFVTTIKFLGLKSLEKVYGVVNLNHKSNLCYANTIPWKEITSDEFSNIKCNATCDPLCTRGCWGPGNSMCYKCQFLDAGGNCVKNCSDATGYYAYKPQKNLTQCRKCHWLCKDNCTGPLSGDCTSCRFAKENGNCVESCSVTHYPVVSKSGGHTECRPCHGSCYFGEILSRRNLSFACSGPSDTIGDGGCSMCHKVILRDNSISCHKDACPNGFFGMRINETLTKWSIEQISCNPCNSLCGLCTDSGTHKSVCKKCKGYWYKDNCVSTCPEKVLNVSRLVKPGDNCPNCHKECRDGCEMENDANTCNHCINKKIFRKQRCVSQCPTERNYTEYIDGDFACMSLEETAEYQQRKRMIIVVVGSLTFLLVAVILIVLLFRYKFRQSKIKAELKAFYSNFNEPNMKNIKDDHVTRPPNMNRLQMIPISDLIFDRQSKPLGAGAFGKVFRGTWKVPGPDGKTYYLDVVVKVIHNSSKTSTNEFLEEAQIMASVSHRHCLPLIGVCLSLDKPCLVSTFAKYGSLEKYLHIYSSKISSYSLLKWSEQIADGMAYLNMRGIIHRDLATRNILVNDKNIVQITDFGLARLVDDTDDGIVVQSGRVPIRWLAIETLLYANYSTASDIWAYGVCLWEIFTFGKRPYEEIDTSKVKAYLQEGNRLYQPDICTLEVYMVMIKCWLEDHLQRPSFTELMSIFEQFSRNSKRYLCIPREHLNDYSSSSDLNKEMICLNQLSMDPEHKTMPTFTNRSDDVSWTNTVNNDSAYHLINQSDSKNDNDDHVFLPSRKKTKRNISFDKLKNFPKIGLTKLRANKSQDSRPCQYFPTNSCDSNKNSCLSYESTAALISHQKSIEYEGPPINPQIAKLLKQESLQSGRVPKIPNKQDSLHYTDRIFNDRNIQEEATRNFAKSNDRKPVNRSPSLPPIDIFRFVSVEPLILPSSADAERKSTNHSPDSGNSHEFDADDYLIPSRVQSQGYYNLTPSPSDNIQPVMDTKGPIVVENDTYSQSMVVDDGYLEPTTKKSSR